jgi:Survival protein SurE
MRSVAFESLKCTVFLVIVVLPSMLATFTFSTREHCLFKSEATRLFTRGLVGMTVYHSGTVGAAREAAIVGIPALAVSVRGDDRRD